MLTFCCFWGDMIETFKILSGTYDAEIAPKLLTGNDNAREHSKYTYKNGQQTKSV